MTAVINERRTVLPERLPNFQQTLPRHLVHRAAVSEVFVTSLAAVQDGVFQVGAQWPRAHQFFGPKLGLHDPMLLPETMRQAGLAVAHTYYNVPIGSYFLMREMSYEIDEEGLRLDCRPADVVLTLVAHDVRKRGKTVAGMTFEIELYRDDTRVGSGRVEWRCVSAATYARVRGDKAANTVVVGNQPAPVGPHLVGRHHEADVVLAPSAVDNLWLLRADTDHPVMFDHPVDHVPGMMALEAARQAALLTSGDPRAVPVNGTFVFDHYIELDEPCVVAGESTDGRVRVKFEQSGRTAVVGELELRGVA
jgi:2-oxo-3-(phosphooxy)propyl 3-oxoalkanoate synthase